MDPRALNERELAFMEAEKARDAKRRAAEREREVDRNIAPVLERLGPKFFADEMGLGVDKQDRVYHWRERRNGQRPPAELLAAVHEQDEAAMGDYCEARGYERPRRKLPADGERLARAYEAKLREYGEKGERDIADARAQAATPDRPEWETSTPSLRKVGP
jgi:hypothetical protein